VDISKLWLFGSDDELTVFILGKVDFIGVGALLVKLASGRFLVEVALLLTATSPASTTMLLVGAAGTLKLLSALSNTRKELSWSHITMLLLIVEARLMMLDRLQHVTMRVGVYAIVGPSSTHGLMLLDVWPPSALFSMMLLGTPVVEVLARLMLIIVLEPLVMILLLTLIPTMVLFLEPISRIMIRLLLWFLIMMSIINVLLMATSVASALSPLRLMV